MEPPFIFSTDVTSSVVMPDCGTGLVIWQLAKITDTAAKIFFIIIDFKKLPDYQLFFVPAFIFESFPIDIIL
jgi:hypothetical protein